MSDWRGVVPTMEAGFACPSCGWTGGGCVRFDCNIEGHDLGYVYHRPYDCTFDEPCGRITECSWCVDLFRIGLTAVEPEDVFAEEEL